MIDEIALLILAYITFAMGGAVDRQDQDRLIEIIFDEPQIEYADHEEGRS
jgi:hypothetical protein